jgi:hypothetical protein
MLCKSKIERSPSACLAIGLLTLLSACSDIYYDCRETVALSADDHLHANRVTQMVDPWPYYVGNKNLVFNGERMQQAAERYRRDCVFPLANPTTSTRYIAQQQDQAAQQQMARCQNGAVPPPPPPPLIPVK